MDELTRGGRKLEAAVTRFRLADTIAGTHAIDIGASTGGFVAVLLRAGAGRVTAVDVGHGQLDASLAADARVENLEGTDWKKLSLHVAAGPFDFFTVDVSFVAARNMLRGLAFRLRPGAQGVVLVKPQFELPDRLVKDSRMDAAQRRQRALQVFAEKAGTLGFRVLEHVDSPVPGGSGTVEVLAHLVFDGRPEHLPQPGERKAERPAPAATSQGAAPRAQKTKPTPAPHAEGELDWFAVAAPGLEAPLGAEVERLAQVSRVRVVPGGVEFRGPLSVGMAANLHLRIATRVLLRLGEVSARDFGPLRRGAAALDWQRYLPGGRPLRIDASASHCRLYHTGALAETLTLAITDRVGRLPPRPDVPDEDDQDENLSRVLIRGQDDRFTISVDASGPLLHRRGWRLEAGRAPLRETLAAGLLALCHHDPAQPFVDPMCGSGTIVLEACAAALRVAPGLGRHFAFEAWPCVDRDAWAHLRAQAQAQVLPAPPAVLVGADRDPLAVDITRRNAERAGFSAHVQLEVAAFGDGSAPSAPGLLLLNPPYGRRLGRPHEATRLGRDVGRILATRYVGWRVGVLSAHPAFAKALAAGIRRSPLARHDLRNGGLRVELLVF